MVEEAPDLLQISPFRPHDDPTARPADPWHALELDVPPRTASRVDVAGEPLLVANLDGTLVAYLDRCAACDTAPSSGTLTATRWPAPAAARRTTSGWPAGRPTTSSSPRCRCFPSTRPGRSHSPPGAGMTATQRSAGGLARLRRINAPAPPQPEPEESCEFCNVPLGARHGHVADTIDHRLMCACRPCYLVFAPDGAGGGRFRAVGEDVRRVGELLLDDVTWDALRVPVDLVFFFRQSAPGRRHPACWPSTRARGARPSPSSTCRPGTGIVAANPVLDEIAPDVEGALLRRHEGSFSAHLVPIDVCYELVGVVRSWWKGLGGGPEVWQRMAAYFDDLDHRAREVSRTGAA